MSVTLIAQKAGVSIATVSRVLNNSRPVSPQIAEAVRKAAEELNLPVRPPRKRRVSSTERPLTVAIASIGQTYRGWFDVPVIASVVAELTRSAQELNITVQINELTDPSEPGSLLKRTPIDGMIGFINAAVTHQQLATLRQAMPIVRIMGGQLGPAEIDHVGADNNAVGYCAATHLINQGLTNLAFFTQRHHWDFIRLRAQGFLCAAEARGIGTTMFLHTESDIPTRFYGPDRHIDSDIDALVTQLAKLRDRGPIGLFVPRDEETVVVYRALASAGLEPGKDVIVQSCDNEQIRLDALHPRPDTIDLGTAEIARRALRRLSYRIKHRDDPPVRILVMPHLVAAKKPS
ncbi:MAG: LacI family DNA-binding transcriptional regulator [Tepidisphaeraceae bacterium]